MIRLVQRKLIIPRGDTGSFTIPALINAAQGDVLVFSILDPLKHAKLFDKIIEAVDGTITIEFTHSETVNLTPGKYVWDIKYYQNPVISDEGKLINGTEVDSYYAAFKLPECEIRETGDEMLISEDAPTGTLSPAQIDLVNAALSTMKNYMDEFKNTITQYARHDELQALSDELNKKAVIADLVFILLAENGTIDEITATEHLDVFAQWAPSVSYTAGNLRVYQDKLYKCLQSHTSQEDQTPDNTPALWKEAGNPADE